MRRDNNTAISRPLEIGKSFSFCCVLVTVLTVFVVCASAYGQEVIAVRKSASTPTWQSATSDAASENTDGTSVLTSVYTLPERVELAFSAPVEFRSASLRGNAGRPSRFYVDISPASLRPQRGATLNIDSGPVRRVRLSLFRAGTIRVVLDLREECHFRVTTLTDPYRLIIVPRGASTMVRHSPQPTTLAKTGPKLESLVAIQQEENKAENSALGFPEITWRPMLHPWSLMPHSPEPPSEEAFEANGHESAASNLAPLHNLPQVLFSLPTLIDAALFAAADASVEWLWEVACQGEGCKPVAEEPAEVKETGRGQIQAIETNTLLMEDSPKTEGDTKQSIQETFRIGGSMMDQIWFVIMTAGVFLAFLAGIGIMILWNLRKRRARTEKRDSWEGRMAYLEEAVNRAGMLNNSFFHSLEISQKRLETLLTQSDVAERNLRRLLHQSAFAGDRTTGRGADSLATASLLLSEGEDVQQVARTLKLPMAQVRLLQELRAYTQEEKPTDLPEKSAAGLRSDSPDGLASRLNGAARNGMHLADNGSQL